MTHLKEKLEKRLVKVFAPYFMEITDESHLHKGHAGARPEGESHFSLTIEASSLEGLTRVQQHQRIYAALDDFFTKEGLHALRITCRSPGVIPISK